MKHLVLILTVTFAAAVGEHGTLSGQRPQADTWYERAARQINPSNTDYGAIWEQYKHAMTDRLRDPYFRFGFGATLAILVLLATSIAQHVGHRRAMEIAIRSIADIRHHDQYARQAAREAIQRYNDHVENCNRVVEADESGLWKWISSTELAAMNSEVQRLNDELKASREEVNRLNAELETKAVTIAEMSLRSTEVTQDSEPSVKRPVPAAHIQ